MGNLLTSKYATPLANIVQPDGLHTAHVDSSHIVQQTALQRHDEPTRFSLYYGSPDQAPYAIPTLYDTETAFTLGSAGSTFNCEYAVRQTKSINNEYRVITYVVCAHQSNINIYLRWKKDPAPYPFAASYTDWSSNNECQTYPVLEGPWTWKYGIYANKKNMVIYQFDQTLYTIRAIGAWRMQHTMKATPTVNGYSGWIANPPQYETKILGVVFVEKGV